MKLRVLVSNNTFQRHLAHHMATGCNNFWLDEPFQRWPGRGKGCQIVIAQIVRRIVVRHGANGDHIGDIARHTNGHGFRTIVTG